MSRTLTEIEYLNHLARDEIGESKVNVAEAVEQVRKVVTEKYSGLRLPSDADALFERCLRTRKFNIISAAEMVHLFYQLLLNFCGIQGASSYLLPSTHKQSWFDSLGFVLLKKRDSLGRAVILFNIDKIPIKSFSMSQFMAVTFLFVTELTRTSVDIQRHGIVYVIDLNGFQLRHARHFTLSILSVMASSVQGSFPVRYKAFHIVRNSNLFSYTYALLRPLLRNKIKNRIYFHGNDLKTLYHHVSPDILPEYLGGGLKDASYADLEFTNQLCTMDEYYSRQFLQHGYMNTP